MLIKCKFKLFLLLVTILSVLLVSTVGLAEGWVPKSIRVGTASGISTFYQYGAPISIILTDVLGMQVSAGTTNGSAENCRLLDKKEVEMAFSVGPTDYFAYNGLPPFDEPITSLRSVMVVDVHPLQIIVLADSDIQSVTDLKGKRFGVGLSGSAQDVMARAILAEFDMSYDDLTPVFVGGALGDLLRDGDIDAFLSTIPIPGAYVTELAQAKPINLIPLPDEVIDNLVAKHVFYTKAIIPAGTYRGVDEDVPVVSTVASVIVHEDLDDTLVYNIVKGILDNKDRIAETYPGAKKHLTVERALKGLAIPMHPGAIKYFEEINHPGLQDAPK